MQSFRAGVFVLTIVGVSTCSQAAAVRIVGGSLTADAYDNVNGSVFETLTPVGQHLNGAWSADNGGSRSLNSAVFTHAPGASRLRFDLEQLVMPGAQDGIAGMSGQITFIADSEVSYEFSGRMGSGNGWGDMLATLRDLGTLEVLYREVDSYATVRVLDDFNSEEPEGMPPTIGSRVGTMRPGVYQLTFSCSTWENYSPVADHGFIEFAFNTVIPLPLGAGLGVAGMIGLVGIRRRA